MNAPTPEWLASLKPGDEVALIGGVGVWGPHEERIVRVKRETAGQFVLDTPGFPKARKSDGLVLGSRHRQRIRPVTNDMRDRIRAAKLKTWARYSAATELAACPLDVIESVHRIVKAARAAQPEAPAC